MMPSLQAVRCDQATVTAMAVIVIASPAAFERVYSLIREIDIPISGEGRINVYYLENANAEEMASRVRRLVDAGDIAMVKGSLGSRVGKVVDAIKTLGEARPSEAPEG
mgnify:CR=1 FL=1